jgi:hypothetical protein
MMHKSSCCQDTIVWKQKLFILELNLNFKISTKTLKVYFMYGLVQVCKIHYIIVTIV